MVFSRFYGYNYIRIIFLRNNCIWSQMTQWMQHELTRSSNIANRTFLLLREPDKSKAWIINVLLYPEHEESTRRSFRMPLTNTMYHIRYTAQSTWTGLSVVDKTT